MWSPFYYETKENKKTEALAVKLGLPVYSACGILALLWAWSIEKASGENGEISEYTVKAIETACGWDGERGRLLAVLQECGFVDGSIDSDTDPLRIHDWAEYNAPIIRRRMKDRERQRRKREKERKDVMQICPRDSHEDYSNSNSIQLSLTVSEVIKDQSFSGGDSESVDAFRKHFREKCLAKNAPSANYIRELLAKGFEMKGLYHIAEITASAMPDNPLAYFKAVCREKEESHVFLEADMQEESMRRKKRSEPEKSKVKYKFY